MGAPKKIEDKSKNWTEEAFPSASEHFTIPGLNKLEEFTKAAMQGLCANPEYLKMLHSRNPGILIKGDNLSIDALGIAKETLKQLGYED